MVITKHRSLILWYKVITQFLRMKHNWSKNLPTPADQNINTQLFIIPVDSVSCYFKFVKCFTKCQLPWVLWKEKTDNIWKYYFSYSSFKMNPFLVVWLIIRSSIYLRQYGMNIQSNFMFYLRNNFSNLWVFFYSSYVRWKGWLRTKVHLNSTSGC